MSTFADWKRMLAIDQFYHLQAAGFPGWNPDEKIVMGREVSCVTFDTEKGKDKTSREMAVEFDGIAEGNFYYRDWTGSGLPFVEDKEVYNSRFWFQYSSDLQKFKDMYLKDRNHS